MSGSRTRKAAALELDIPIVKQLDATLAGRYDQYTFADHSDSKFTWNVGLQYRPIDTLLLRGNYATSFRAPDMNYIYEASTKGYYASTTDYYRCYKANQSLSNCDYANYSPGANYVETATAICNQKTASHLVMALSGRPTATLISRSITGTSRSTIW